MKTLMDILMQFDVAEHEVAEMIYAYLLEHGEKDDRELFETISKTFFNRG